MRIAIKKLNKEALTPEQLRDYLSYELRLSKDRISYEHGEDHDYGFLVIKEHDFKEIDGKETKVKLPGFDKQELGMMLHYLGYMQVTEFDKQRPNEGRVKKISGVLVSAREIAEQLGSRIKLEDILKNFGGKK